MSLFNCVDQAKQVLLSCEVVSRADSASCVITVKLTASKAALIDLAPHFLQAGQKLPDHIQCASERDGDFILLVPSDVCFLDRLIIALLPGFIKAKGFRSVDEIETRIADVVIQILKDWHIPEEHQKAMREMAKNEVITISAIGTALSKVRSEARAHEPTVAQILAELGALGITGTGSGMRLTSGEDRKKYPSP